MTRSSTRRRYLAAGVAAGFATVAGCSDLIEEYDESEEPEESQGTEDPVENIDHENPEGELALVEPEDGAQVSSPVTFAMEVENFDLQPAEGDQDDDSDEASTPDQGAGHLHVIVDEDCVDPGYVIPEEEGYYHLGDGASETEIDLEPGEHDVCAQAGDDQHAAYDMTEEITVEVTEGSGGGGNESDDGSGGNETSNGNETGEGNESDSGNDTGR